MLPINLISALVEVHRRGLGSKGIQPHVLQFLRKNGNGDGRSLFGVDVEVQLRIRVEALEFLVSFRRGASYSTGVSDEPVFNRLRNGNLVFD